MRDQSQPSITPVPEQPNPAEVAKSEVDHFVDRLMHLQDRVQALTGYAEEAPGSSETSNKQMQSFQENFFARIDTMRSRYLEQVLDGLFSQLTVELSELEAKHMQPVPATGTTR